MTTTKINKGWGHELIFANEDDYCGKFLNFNEGARFSMHYHVDKDETWFVQYGEFEVHWIDTKTAKINIQKLSVGDTWRNERFVPHQLHCIREGAIIEVSTHDDPEDNYRVLPGDSQTK